MGVALDGDPLLQLPLLVAASLSLAGAGFIVVSYLVFKQYRLFHLRMILYLSICDLLSAGSMIFSFFVTRGLVVFGEFDCTLSGVLVIMFQFASILWSACVAHMITQTIRAVQSKPSGSGRALHKLEAPKSSRCLCFCKVLHGREPERFEPVYFLISLGTPIVYFSAVLGLQEIGPGPFWCWVVGDSGIWLFESIIAALCLLYNLGCVVWVVAKLHGQRTLYGASDMTRRSSLSSLETTFLFFVLALWMCWAPGLFNGFDNSPFWLNYLQVAGNPLQGFLNALIYGFNDELRQSYRDACCGRPRYSFLDDAGSGPALNWDPNDAYRADDVDGED